MSSSHWQEVLREVLLPVECAPNLVWWSQLTGRAQCQAYLISLPLEMRNGSVLLLFSFAPEERQVKCEFVITTPRFFHLSHVGRYVKYM